MEGDSSSSRTLNGWSGFLSTPSGWRATTFVNYPRNRARISIHALRVEGDLYFGMIETRRSHFYPRPPGGGRPNNEFSTWKTAFISIHALRVEGDDKLYEIKTQIFNISIHALRVEGDRKKVQQMSKFTTISIHALRVEGDIIFIHFRHFRKNFYPRPPGGGRLRVLIMVCANILFLSTPSGWRATTVRRLCRPCSAFLSTPSGWRATVSLRRSLTKCLIFLSTPSGWRATLRGTL